VLRLEDEKAVCVKFATPLGCTSAA
jgi:hypothetical protein